MATNRSHSAKISGYVFILWGDKFEEAEAATFATEFRRAGLCVKLIGLTGQRSSGVHGLILYSDMTLGEALPLARQAICVVIPCNAATIKRMENDPRVAAFIKQASAKHARFVMKQLTAVEKSLMGESVIPIDQIAMYTESEDLKRFAHDVAEVVSNTARGEKYSR
jgi:hypothetical protein